MNPPTLSPHLCNRCGHVWLPRTFGDPKRCPKCKSPYWNRPRRDRVTEKSQEEQEVTA